MDEVEFRTISPALLAEALSTFAAALKRTRAMARMLEESSGLQSFREEGTALVVAIERDLLTWRSELAKELQVLERLKAPWWLTEGMASIDEALCRMLGAVRPPGGFSRASAGGL
jgi:hypothetical protein